MPENLTCTFEFSVAPRADKSTKRSPKALWASFFAHQSSLSWPIFWFESSTNSRTVQAAMITIAYWSRPRCLASDKIRANRGATGNVCIVSPKSVILPDIFCLLLLRVFLPFNQAEKNRAKVVWNLKNATKIKQITYYKSLAMPENCSNAPSFISNLSAETNFAASGAVTKGKFRIWSIPKCFIPRTKSSSGRCWISASGNWTKSW